MTSEITVPTVVKEKGRPIGSGGKYTINPNQKRTRKSGLTYIKPELTAEQIEQKKEYKRLSAMAHYIRKKHSRTILKASLEEKQQLKDKILANITNKLANMTKDELETIINIMPNDLTIFTNLL